MTPNKKRNRRIRSGISVTFGVTSLTRKLGALGSELGMTPSNAFEIGDELVTSSGRHAQGRSVWQLRSDGAILSTEIKDHIAYLLQRIEPSRAHIQRYLDDAETEVNVRIDFQCEECYGGIAVASDLMKRLAALANRVNICFTGEVVSGVEKEDDRDER